MKIYTLRDITRRLKQDEMTDYLERFQFSKKPMWENWFEDDDVYKIKFKSNHDEREFEDDIFIIGIPLTIVDLLARIDSFQFMIDNPLTLDNTKVAVQERIAEIKNEIWGTSYRYGSEGYGKNDIYVFWIWNNGYFNGVYKGKKSAILAK